MLRTSGSRPPPRKKNRCASAALLRQKSAAAVSRIVLPGRRRSVGPMGVSDRFAFPKTPLGILLGGHGIAAAAAGGRTSQAFHQRTNGRDHPPQHAAILTRRRLKGLQGSWLDGEVVEPTASP